MCTKNERFSPLTILADLPQPLSLLSNGEKNNLQPLLFQLVEHVI